MDKGVNFVPVTEKSDHYQIKKDLERLGRDIKLKMYHKNEPTPPFSEKPAFKISSNWIPPIQDAQLELYLREIEDILLILMKTMQVTQILLRISVKRVQIRSFFWSVFSHIWTEYGKIRTRKNFVFGYFSRNVILSKFKRI